jgi:ubiquitin
MAETASTSGAEIIQCHAALNIGTVQLLTHSMRYFLGPETGDKMGREYTLLAAEPSGRGSSPELLRGERQHADQDDRPRLRGMILNNRESGAERVAHTAGALLYDMRQFVAE